MTDEVQILETYFGFGALKLAWERMIRSTGSDVKDYFGIEIFGENLDDSLWSLHRSIMKGEYQPQRPFKYFEPKPSKTQRTKTVLAIEDALFYQAIGNQVGHVNYGVLAESNRYVFGSRLHPEVERGLAVLEEEDAEFYFYQFYVPLHNQFIDSINKEIKNSEIKYKLETDITGFFDSIPHSKLVSTLHRFGVEAPILDLILPCLNMWSGTKGSPTLGVGIPQGAPTSFLFANLLLSELDKQVINEGYTYYRYMDDIRIYEEDESKLVEALVLIDGHLKGKALSLNTKKTSIEELADNRETIPLMPEYGVDDEDIWVEEGGKVDELDSLDFHGEHGPEISDDGRTHWRTISGSELVNFCKREIVEVETFLLEQFRQLAAPDFLPRQLSTNEELKKEIVHLAYRWRNASSILKEEKQLPPPNTAMIPIWLFCLEHFFWKANHFCWNLNLYGDNQLIEDQLWVLFERFGIYEWVRYQILYNLAHSQKFTPTNLKELFRRMKTENSSLVRLGYYHILIKHVNHKSQLFTSIGQLVKEEKEVYVRKVVSNILSRVDRRVSRGEIKSWFGL